jgi:preprotein translocase subunit SecE
MEETKSKSGLITYLETVKDELLLKVSWPTWSELQESTVLVFLTTFILVLAIFLMDFIFGKSGDINSTWKGLIGFIYAFI